MTNKDLNADRRATLIASRYDNLKFAPLPKADTSKNRQRGARSRKARRVIL